MVPYCTADRGFSASSTVLVLDLLDVCLIISNDAKSFYKRTECYEEETLFWSRDKKKKK